MGDCRLVCLHLSMLLNAGSDEFSAPSSVGITVICLLSKFTTPGGVGKLLLRDTFFAIFFLLFFTLGH